MVLEATLLNTQHYNVRIKCYILIIITPRRRKTSEDSFRKNMYLSFYCNACVWEGAGDRTKTAIYWPPLLWPSALCLSRSPDAQSEAQEPSSLLDDGFLYCILSATSLDPNSIGGTEGPFGLEWLSLPHLANNSVRSLTVWLLVLTELYISSTPTQSPAQSLEWHVWLSSSGNNCHVVQR